MFKEQGQNAAILSHMIDNHFISFIEYKEKDYKFARIDSEIGEAMKSGESAGDADKIIEVFKKSIDKGEVTVKAETLKSSQTPAVMLLSEYSRRMQDMSKSFGEAFAGEKPETTVVLNLGNEVVKAIPTLSEEDAKLVCLHIYDLALLSHKPLDAGELAGFIDRSVKILGMFSGNAYEG
jgi:molecular chaperone HtpG